MRKKTIKMITYPITYCLNEFLITDAQLFKLFIYTPYNLLLVTALSLSISLISFLFCINKKNPVKGS